MTLDLVLSEVLSLRKTSQPLTSSVVWCPWWVRALDSILLAVVFTGIYHQHSFGFHTFRTVIILNSLTLTSFTSFSFDLRNREKNLVYSETLKLSSIYSCAPDFISHLTSPCSLPWSGAVRHRPPGWPRCWRSFSMKFIANIPSDFILSGS